jgi:putative FmdB family regulatory protein
MPTYQYQCKDCKHRFEITRSYSDPQSGLPECERCGGTNTRRVMTSVYAKTGSEHELAMAGSSQGCSSCGRKSASSCSRCGH